MKRFFFTARFKKLFKKLPDSLKKKVNRQLKLLGENPQHPSLHAKKMVNTDNIWEARVDYQHRFTFKKTGDIIILRAVGSHDVLKTP
jgi:mRNA interferase RelE/StbE